ncbi:alpha-hydroxy acid oxidase [Beijerinckia sp. L45]|uniref:alpha-hydroxy acid oxidase n=1 Tax=Beijerinckia sp. L45 TaxID=1641855 RepID=UPI00131A8E17|nr:alpha-hydroxy acid oxidase [Beijerinckia sp. L45]
MVAAAHSLPALAANEYFRDFTITSPGQALDIFDLEKTAKDHVPPAHWASLIGGTEGDQTVLANRQGFTRFRVKPRRLVDTSKLDMSVTLFGRTWPTPIIIDPVSRLKAFHPDGEVAVAAAAKKRDHLQIYATLATSSIDEVLAARQEPVWCQLYPTADWAITQGLVKKQEAAGCPVLVVTIDNPSTFGRITAARGKQNDTRTCTDCHSPEPGGPYMRLPMFDGLDTTKLTATTTNKLTWDLIPRLRDLTTMKIILKGVMSGSDATLALEHKVDGIIVSDHGGRSEESGLSTIEVLPEVVRAVGGRMPILIDSGFRRGSDIFKALALGATAVCVGRPYVWGLAAFGEAGVDRALEILTEEFKSAMISFGAPNVASIDRSFLFESSL